MAEIVNDIWYANQERASSSLKFIAYDAKGVFDFGDHDIIFKGGGIEVVIGRNSTICMGHQRFKWLSWLIVIAFSLLIYGPIYWIMSIISGFIANAFLYLYIICIFNGIGINFFMKWVVVENVNQDGITIKHYFFDGGRSGWRGIFGGSSKLYRKIIDWKSLNEEG